MMGLFAANALHPHCRGESDRHGISVVTHCRPAPFYCKPCNNRPTLQHFLGRPKVEADSANCVGAAQG